MILKYEDIKLVKRIPRIVSNNWFFIFLSILFIGLRIFASDPWTGAIATNDTDSYAATARAPLLSREFISGYRPITLPLVYKLFAPAQGYDTSIRSEPSIRKSPGLLDLPGFSGIAVFQSALSVIAWWVLAFALYRKGKNPWLRNFFCAFILLSACLPEIVSWDHVMMSESLTYSLFAFLLAVSLFLFDKGLFNGEKADKRKQWLAVGFLLALFFWVNTRDTNVYFLLVYLVCLAFGLLVPFLARKGRNFPILGVAILAVSLAIYGFQQVSARGSIRLVNPLINNLTSNIFPFPDRVKFMHDNWGMPDSEDIISNTSSANYSKITLNKDFTAWVQSSGMSAYMSFMMHYPLNTTQMLINSFSENFGYYKQPYYDPWYLKLPVRLNQLTRLINWSSSDLILISLLLIVACTGRNIHVSNSALWPVIGIMACIWLGAGVMYAASYLGETWGSASRHIQNVILAYRMLVLVFIPVLFES